MTSLAPSEHAQAPPALSPKNNPVDLRVPPSPAPTALSFKNGDDLATTRQKDTMRDIDRDTPAAPRGGSKKEVGRKRSMKGANYYGEVFSVRDNEPKVPKAAGVVAELRTNVILEDEFTFVAALSRFLASRFSKPESAVVVHLVHSAVMIAGGTFDATYYLTVTSCASISPTCNKRNAALFADWFHNNLGVAPARGFVNFHDPDFANFAVGGQTVLDMMEIEERRRTGTAERTDVWRDRSIKRSLTRAKGSRKEREREREWERERERDEHMFRDGQRDSAESGPRPPLQPPLQPVDEMEQSLEKRPSTAPPGGKLKRKSMFSLFARG